MATIDVTSLYTSILHSEGLAALRHYLSLRRTPQIPGTDFLLDLSHFILTLNAFSFNNNNNYLQVCSCAIGSRFSPSYANLFLGLFEENFLTNYPLKLLLWLRNVDDIFLLRSHDINSFS